jgi:hypothetical protein
MLKTIVFANEEFEPATGNTLASAAADCKGVATLDWINKEFKLVVDDDKVTRALQSFNSGRKLYVGNKCATVSSVRKEAENDKYVTIANIGCYTLQTNPVRKDWLFLSGGIAVRTVGNIDDVMFYIEQELIKPKD